MIREYELNPVHAGVVYSPGGTGWQFYPEEQLFVGLTGTIAAKTHVRSVLSFSPPELGHEPFLLRADLNLHVTRNEPLGLPKLICLRETPAGVSTPWTLPAEHNQPVCAEHHLSSEIGQELVFDLTGLVTAWRYGADNNGLLLDFGDDIPGLVAFGNGFHGEPAPSLKLTYAFPSPRAAIASMEIDPDASMDSKKFPCQELVIKNMGPGLAWISPQYSFDEESYVDPAGIPLGVLEPGGSLCVQPELPAIWMRVRVTTVLTRTRVVIIPLAFDEPGQGGES